jgi:hypothetical protein
MQEGCGRQALITTIVTATIPIFNTTFHAFIYSATGTDMYSKCDIYQLILLDTIIPAVLALHQRQCNVAQTGCSGCPYFKEIRLTHWPDYAGNE